MEPQLNIIQGMVSLVGIGYAMIGTSSFCRAQAAALKLGYQDDISTYLMISGKKNYFLIYCIKVFVKLMTEILRNELFCFCSLQECGLHSFILEIV